ncbi:MAG TPA: SURF1 family protein [Microlunatus sp.]|nr:SURF1 family protein [Microlunatus sp.]
MATTASDKSASSTVLLAQIGIIVLGCVIAGAMALLGVWQLKVYEEQGAEASAARAAQPPVPLSAVAPPASRVTEGFGLSVRFSGVYDPALQALVPLAGSSSQMRVLAGLRQADGSTVAVVRGLVPVTTTEIPAPPSAEVTQVGVLLPSEEAGASMPSSGSTDGSTATLPSVRVPLLAQTWPGPMIDGYVVLSAADAQVGGLTPAPLVLPEGQGRLRNGAYAAQWWLFGLFAIVMSARIARDLGEKSELDAPLTLIR